MIAPVETTHGTLHYMVIETTNGYMGEIKNDLHKTTRFNGKVLTRHSKLYKTERGAANWLGKQRDLQIKPLKESTDA